jgi:hypothetical protein
MQNTPGDRPGHGHHKVAAAIFVGALILGAAMILSAELMKPERYEFHPGSDPGKYIIYDRNTGRATAAEFDAKTPTAPLGD